jgi:hypothetical protein
VLIRGREAVSTLKSGRNSREIEQLPQGRHALRNTVPPNTEIQRHTSEDGDANLEQVA